MRKALTVLLTLTLAATAAMGRTRGRSRSGSHSSSRPAATHKISADGMFEALHNISDVDIRDYIEYLASDKLEGRGTGARGGDLAADYIADHFKQFGLTPGGEKGTYFQNVPMVGLTTLPTTTLSFATEKKSYNLKLLEQFVASDESRQSVSDLSGKLLFVGYGITAPEQNWNDFAGVDVKGRILLMLVNEPPSKDPKFFAGDKMTYYGRWTYKFEHAAAAGAAGVILIHRDDMATYDWGVVRHSWNGERSTLDEASTMGAHFNGWIHHDVAKQLLADAGYDVDKLIDEAGKPGFKAIELPITANAHVATTVRKFASRNVIGILPGSDENLKNEAILYTAHYDHLGIHPDETGDNIYNGALDNASGAAMLMDMAKAAAAAPIRPKRSLIFASVTAEEQGLWGSQYLGEHPPIPTGRISLDLNYDMILPLGIPREVRAQGFERTDFAPIFEATAADFKMKILPPETPDSGGYYRSDHFSLARFGVPAFSIENGDHFDQHPAKWVEENAKRLGDTYHTPKDEFWPEGDYRSDAVYARFGLALGYRAAALPARVEWKSGDEFDAARKAESK